MAGRIGIDGTATAGRRERRCPEALGSCSRVVGVIEVQVEMDLLGRVWVVPSRRDVAGDGLEGEREMSRSADRDPATCILARVGETQEPGPEGRDLLRVLALHRHACQP